MSKVVYILPLYDENTDTHLYYNYELIRYAAAQTDIFVVIEKAEGQVNLNTPFQVQKQRGKLLRFFELYGILRRLRRQGYENFYVHYSYYGALAALLVGGKVYYWNRGMPWLFARGFWEERIFRFILRRTILVTGPESLAKEYVKHYGVKRYKILSNWVDVQRFKPREDKASTKRWFALEPNLKVVLFVHHLSERKGADLVPRIAEGFGKDFKFWVIGEGPYLEKIKNQKSKIKIFGKISNQAISVYFQAADVFILPSREEGSPHVILEALAAGTPFVASDVGGIREIVPPGFREFLCPVGDVSCFQEKINKLLEDENLYQKLSREGLEFARKFDKSRGVSEFLNLFYN
ncbi:hypothetical protein A2757_00700 [Candidatus Giovannonibacteria bacterium RIFCSPHIGHO2_01_FULL_48_47]|nr:MAG: hypothetical protein A2757_00700 [Candidatus Giovannonibacteria bacterium RIFCSPHIGHO2_01_FULL_48_47]OGF68342.1 MAG: hypothetical protein A3D61_00465 [Candidatus Giovannonibacteria bacterium RIFCSPHIGHO2_02_FULL_48_15]OGF87989.1 MAG: hypothetical protein A3B26_03810 [Candidatus Giovannonibacteria bacterium RIFCSPLOWO2_01_FULL_48_47]OGF95519.1 MAG: hypothetical protein A2433_02185 [Candidatus Giovannonibacteria bacterium RIFOXYC1_FULL_48_8]OGF96204.1 MAG: hypothetical protein A2613_01385